MSDLFNECGSFNVGDLKLNLQQAKELLEDVVKLKDKRIADLEAQLKEAQERITYLRNENAEHGNDAERTTKFLMRFLDYYPMGINKELDELAEEIRKGGGE